MFLCIFCFAAGAFSLLLLLFILPVITAAMLCPVLFCAALLLLTPLEITEARALHPSTDAGQVKEKMMEEKGGGGLWGDLECIVDMRKVQKEKQEEESGNNNRRE